jgi:hypothetical protein
MQSPGSIARHLYSESVTRELRFVGIKIDSKLVYFD